MEQKYEELQFRASALQHALEKAPEGTLTYNQVCDRFYYYIQLKHNGKRVRRYLTDPALLSALLSKKIRKALLQDTNNEMEAAESYLKKRKNYSPAKVLEKDAMRFLLIKTLDKWQNADYETNPYHPEGLNVEGANGVMVSSKSEGDITWGLADAALPNRYEQKTIVNGKVIYPDFTIFHPTTGQIILWEHFGKMDDPHYAQKAYRKISDYIKEGYFPGDNLIVTYEDKKHPLTNRRIRAEIQYYFGEWLEVQK